MILRPRRPWLDLRPGELWHARDLILLFVRRDFVAAYKQTVLGPLWYLIQPLLTSIIFTLIFGRIASLPTDGVPDFLFYMSGTVIWSYFAACLTKTSDDLHGQRGALRQGLLPAAGRADLDRDLQPDHVRHPVRDVPGLPGLLHAVRRRRGTQRPRSLLLPLLLLMMAGLGLGFGIIISSLTTRYRDLQQLVGFGVQLLMYATPVIYPVSAVPKPLLPLILANPLTPIVDWFRYAFLGSGTVSAWGLRVQRRLHRSRAGRGPAALQPDRADVHGHGLTDLRVRIAD